MSIKSYLSSPRPLVLLQYLTISAASFSVSSTPISYALTLKLSGVICSPSANSLNNLSYFLPPKHPISVSFSARKISTKSSTSMKPGSLCLILLRKSRYILVSLLLLLASLFVILTEARDELLELFDAELLLRLVGEFADDDVQGFGREARRNERRQLYAVDGVREDLARADGGALHFNIIIPFGRVQQGESGVMGIRQRDIREVNLCSTTIKELIRAYNSGYIRLVLQYF